MDCSAQLPGLADEELLIVFVLIADFERVSFGWRSQNSKIFGPDLFVSLLSGGRAQRQNIFNC